MRAGLAEPLRKHKPTIRALGDLIEKGIYRLVLCTLCNLRIQHRVCCAWPAVRVNRTLLFGCIFHVALVGVGCMLPISGFLADG